MDKTFVTDISQDLPYMLDFSAHKDTPLRMAIQRISCIVVIVCFLWLAVLSPETLKLTSAIALFVIGLQHLRSKDGGKRYQKLLECTGGVPVRNVITINSQGIRFRNPDTGNIKELTFDQIKRIERTGMLYILTCADGTVCAMDRTRVSGGTAVELDAFLLEKTGLSRIRRLFDSRWLRKAMVYTAAVSFIWSACNIYTFFQPKPVVMDCRQAAQVLTELGIDPPAEEVLEELEVYGASEYILLELLCYSGMGEYDPDTYEWTPSESGVYAFDLEFWDVGSMYTDFLRGVEAMSRGALEFTDIIEDDSHVDYESGGGWKEITLTIDGETRTFRVQMSYDWFDPNFVNELSSFLGTGPEGETFRFLYDGGQMVCVFWCTGQWAESFSEATGWELTATLN